MAEKIQNRYRRLFELRLLHHYWLDEGERLFDSLPKEQQGKRLESYDSRRFFVIAPTAGTARILNGLGAVYKTTALGCFVAVLDKVKIPADTMFEFAVTVRDEDFFNYTALTLRSQKIYEFYSKNDKKIYRYKENVFVLSNQSGTIRENIGSDEKGILFLSKEFPAAADGMESLFIDNDQLKQIISDKLNDAKELAIKSGSPVYVHQGGVPGITPPPTLSEEEKEKWEENIPKHGWLLSDGIPDDVFALIRLQSRPNRLDKNEEFFSLVGKNGLAKEKVDENGQKKDAHPVFHIRFKNRSTFWRYIDRKKEPGESQESTEPLPLTYFGNPINKQKPLKEHPVKIEKGNDGKIAKLVSEIFI